MSERKLPNAGDQKEEQDHAHHLVVERESQPSLLTPPAADHACR